MIDDVDGAGVANSFHVCPSQRSSSRLPSPPTLISSPAARHMFAVGHAIPRSSELTSFGLGLGCTLQCAGVAAADPYAAPHAPLNPSARSVAAVTPNVARRH